MCFTTSLLFYIANNWKNPLFNNLPFFSGHITKYYKAIKIMYPKNFNDMGKCSYYIFLTIKIGYQSL